MSQRVAYGGTDGGGGAHTSWGYTHDYYTYDAAGQLLNSVAAGQNAQHYVYDGMGRVTSTTDVNGGTTSFYFNDAATQTVVTLASGLIQTSTYNKAGELVSATESGSHVSTGTALNYYDQNGRVRITVDATNRHHYYVLDKVGRRIADVSQDGHMTEYRYDDWAGGAVICLSDPSAK